MLFFSVSLGLFGSRWRLFVLNRVLACDAVISYVQYVVLICIGYLYCCTCYTPFCLCVNHMFKWCNHLCEQNELNSECSHFFLAKLLNVYIVHTLLIVVVLSVLVDMSAHVEYMFVHCTSQPMSYMVFFFSLCSFSMITLHSIHVHVCMFKFFWFLWNIPLLIIIGLKSKKE